MPGEFLKGLEIGKTDGRNAHGVLRRPDCKTLHGSLSIVCQLVTREGHRME